jgi:hypothetical protein
LTDDLRSSQQLSPSGVLKLQTQTAAAGIEWPVGIITVIRWPQYVHQQPAAS